MSPEALLSRFFFLIFILLSAVMVSFCMGSNSGHEMTMKPAATQTAGLVVLDETRRRLGSFQVCGLCTCCGGPRNLCVPSPCCYAINCNLPNRPFGVCALTPRSCSCIGCTF